MERSLSDTDKTVRLELHRAVFENRHDQLETILADLKQTGTCDQVINTKDKHGNSPLHLAVLLNRTDCLETLLAYNARVRAKNNDGWSALAEAVGCGNRPIVKRLVSRVLNRDEQYVPSGNRMKLQQTFESVPDFQLDIEWQFKTWIPLASRFMPSDICRISKCGTRIRVDSTLIDFQNMKWERGNVSYLFDPMESKNTNDPNDHWLRYPVYLIDHDRRIYSPFLINNESIDAEEDVNTLMTTPLHQMEIVSKNAYVSRIQTGWFMKEAKTERIADKYMCDFYSVHNIRVVTTKRTEHLSPDDLLKSKKMLKEMLENDTQPIAAVEENESDSDNDNNDTKQDSVNNNNNSLNENYDFVEPKVTWDEYIGAEPGQYQNIRPRPVIQTVKSKELKLTVALSKEFPISMRVLTELLEVVTPLNRFKKLRDFMDLKLPLKSEGFPVRIEFPVFPGITAQVTFLNFEWRSSSNGNTEQSYAELFTIPNSYTLDTNTRCTWLTG